MSTVTRTVLFTDLVGSTELLVRDGEDEANRLRRAHFSLLREAIAATGGREVKNLGDGLMVVFDGVGSGLACAVAIQQRSSARPPHGESLAVRIGVAVGEADEEDGDYFGLPVIEAARLCERAQGGEILTTDFLRLLARSRGGYEFEPIGVAELKGLPEPIPVHRVRWEPVDSTPMPVPPRLRAVVPGAFAGRSDELDVLGTALEEVLAGRRRAVLVSGEPGIGKTTLTASFALAAAEGEASVLYGRCDEGVGVPYQPWVEALEHLVEHVPDEVLAEHVEACGHRLGRIVPGLARRAPGAVASEGAGEPERHLLYGAVTDLLVRTAAVAPVVVVLDDLHWADDPTVQLLRHVLSSTATVPLLVMGTFRETEVSRGSPLGAALAVFHREPGVDRIALRGFGDEELLALLEAIAGHDLDDGALALRKALLAETDGNPFFIVELLRHLLDEGSLFRDGSGRWQASSDLDRVGLPVSIREVVGSRVARLGERTEKVLTVASVIGRDFDVELLARVVGFSEEEVLDCCDAAVEAALLNETAQPEHYSFAHALIERSLYDDLSGGRRARAHRAVAEAIEDLFGAQGDDRVVELARHHMQATRFQDPAKAVRYSRLAAERALRQVAPAEAVRWAAEALALLSSGEVASPDGIALRVALGEAQRHLGDPQHRATLLSAASDALSAGERDLLVRAVLANSRGFASRRIGTVDEERVALLRAALEEVGPSASGERALLLATLVSELQYEDGEERFGLAVEATTLAAELVDPVLYIDVYTRLAEGWTSPQTLPERRRCADRACALADELGEPTWRWYSRWRATYVAAELGDRAGYEAHLEVMEQLLDPLDLPFFRWQTLAARAMSESLNGDPDRAAAAARQCLEAGSDHWPEDALQVWGAQALTTAWVQGALEQQVDLAEVSARDNPGMAIYQAVLAFVYAFAGNTDEAARLLDEARSGGFAHRRDHVQLVAYGLWAQVAWLLGDRRSAEVLVGLLEPWTDRVATTNSNFNQAVAHYAGIARATLGDHEAAVAHLEAAVAIYRQMPAPQLEAVSAATLAGVLVDRDGPGDRERARLLAEEHLALASERGWGYVGRFAQAALDRLA